jgi:hypothetical protein
VPILRTSFFALTHVGLLISALTGGHKGQLPKALLAPFLRKHFGDESKIANSRLPNNDEDIQRDNEAEMQVLTNSTTVEIVNG